MDVDAATPTLPAGPLIVPGRPMEAEPAGRFGPSLPYAIAVAGLHATLIAALALLSQGRQLPPAPPAIGIPVIFAPAAPQRLDPPATTHVFAASTLAVSMEPAPARPASLPPLTLAAGAYRPILQRAPEPDNQARSIPRPEKRPVLAEPIAQASTSPTDTLRAMAEWEAGVRQAVQNAATYPPAARLMHRDGRAQVRFDYERGLVKLPAIAQSSHVASLDNAALAAVTGAAIPAPPAGLGLRERTLLVWVQFRLQAAD